MKTEKQGINLQEAIIPSITLLFAILYLVQTADAPKVAIRWPYAVVGTTALFWLVILFRFVFKSKADFVLPSRSGLMKSVIMILVPIGYLLAMPYLGFAVSSFLFQLLLYRLLGSRSWWNNLAVAFLITSILQITLVVFLQMSLPRLEIAGFVI